MRITIDKYSGFCFGVVYAIEMAESILTNEGSLYCLGDIVHNNKEVDRLNALGLKIIDHNDLKGLKDCKVLIRAHGEPPSTYDIALKNNIQLLDASGNEVDFIDCNDDLGWPTDRGNAGELDDPYSDNNDPENWASSVADGTYMATEEDESKIIFEPYDLDNSMALFQDGPKSAHGTRMITNNLERRALQITLEEYDDDQGWTGGNPKI